MLGEEEKNREKKKKKDELFLLFFPIFLPLLLFCQVPSALSKHMLHLHYVLQKFYTTISLTVNCLCQYCMMPRLSEESCTGIRELLCCPKSRPRTLIIAKSHPQLWLSEYSGLIFTHESGKTLTDQHLNTKQWIDYFLCRKVHVLNLVLQDPTTSGTSSPH